MVISDLCDFSDGYVVVKETIITVTGTSNNVENISL